ncbi:MAG: glycosyltransferase family 4 protein [Nitrospirota bacterium]|nr:glycosyltransferase family 4 protein [Nitrospirota bacterium]
MTILHTETLKKWGGQQNRVLMEAIGLRDRGHRIIIACYKESMLAQKAKEAGITVYELNMAREAHLSTIPKLVSIIRREHVDIVSTHSSVDSWAGGIAAKLAGRKLVRFRHNIYPIGRDPLTSFIYWLPESLVAISATVGDVLLLRGIDKKKVLIIPSSVDIERFSTETEDLRNELGISPETMVIGNTSSFTSVKGQNFLLEAFNEIGGKYPCLLMFAGRLSKQYQEKYLSVVKKPLRDKVLFLGHRDDIPRVLKTYDVFVFPSVIEGLGTSLLEAMAMARPVVVSDIPTFRDFVDDHRTGIFFEAQNAEALAGKVIYLLGNNELRKKIGMNAHSMICERYSLQNMLDATEAMYREVLGVQ